MTSIPRQDPSLPHVLVLGGGFGGLWATRALASAPVRVTLVDRTNHHLFQPLLYQVATAGLSAPDIAAPLRHILRRQRNVTVLLGDAIAIDVERKTVRLSPLSSDPSASLPVGPSLPAGREKAMASPRDDTSLGYDFLVVATGATHAYFGHDDWAAHAPGLKTLDDALAIRRRVLSAFEAAEREEDPAARAAWLNFVVIGAGPTGVELAGTLAEIARHTLPREFRRCDPRQARIHLVEAGPRVLAAMPEPLSDSARRQLEKLGVEVRTGQAVTAIDAGGVAIGAVRLDSRSVLWAAGVAASSLGAGLGVPLDRAGRVMVEPDLAIPGYPDVFVVGDLAHVVRTDGRPVPGIAPAAKQMGAHVAGSIRARLRGVHTKPFRYRDYGNLATIGRMAAVVDLGRLRFSGLIAWWFWLAAHIVFLIGFRNRMVVLIDWAWSYLSYQRSARIIVGNDGNDDRG